MATTAQQVFKKIVVHNKMMTEAQVDRLLVQMPDPETAIKFLVKKEKLSLDKGKQLFAVYKRHLEKVGGGGSSVLRSDVVKRKPTPDESFAAMFDEILSDKPADSAAKPVASADEIKKELEAKEAARIAAEKEKQKAAGKSAAAAAAAAAAIEDDEVATSPPIDPAATFEIPEVEDSVPDDDELPMLERDTDDDSGEYELAPTDIPAPKPSAAKKVEKKLAAAVDAAPTDAAPAAVSQPVKPAGPIDPLIKQLLLAARNANASDAHIKSNEKPLMRVAGALREIDGFDAIDPDKCRAGLLTLLNSRQREKFVRTNDLDFCFDGGAELGRMRTNFLSQFRGTDGIFRLIPTKIPNFDELGLPETVKKFTEYKQGIVLITGPKGSGKTTTLAAMVDLINRTRPEHIITVEDPIEFVHPCKKGHVNQREVGPHTETFSAALRAALREAPDVIMVGEMRDLETISLAITAAETGHLVFGTLHTPDALRTIDRVLDVFPPKEQGQIRSMLSESLRGIVSQLLLPSVDGKSQVLGLEIMVNNSAIGHLIREAKTFQLRGIMQTGKKLGMVLMDDSLIKLVKEGKLKKEEALTMASERKEMEQRLG